MDRSVLWVLLLVLSVAINVPVPAMGEGYTAKVMLRIEGAMKTTFEGVIVTEGHNVTSVLGGTHDCDGTNGGANPTPGPTPTTALDDAARLKGFTWDGPYLADFQDFVVTRIADSTQTPTKFWGLLVGYQFTPTGGCQMQVKTGDEILWAYDAFNKQFFLKLTGPSQAKKNKPFQLIVTNAVSGVPVAGAVVSAGAGVSGTSNANGVVTFTVKTRDLLTFKAEHPAAIRSNAITVQFKKI